MDIFSYLIVLSSALSTLHGHSLYTNLTLESDKVCQLNFKIRELTLGREEKSGLIVRHTNYLDKWPGRNIFECKFTVKAAFNRGIFAVIQKMSFRKNPETGECIDYIQFRHLQRGKIISLLGYDIPKLKLEGESNWEPKYCGELWRFREPASDKVADGQAPNVYQDAEGEIEVKIHVGKVKLEPNQTIDIEVAFTSYIECNIDTGSDKFCGSKACIYKEYFEDGIVNCPYCIDESGCPISTHGDDMDSRLGLNTRITVTAATSIFLSFFLFLGCIWLCRYFEMFCWRGGGDRSVEEGERGSSRQEMSPVVGGDPSAPPPPTSASDKDLPPAYETLFPDR